MTRINDARETERIAIDGEEHPEYRAWQGLPRDIPLSGPIDSDGNGRTDIAVFRPTASPPSVYVKRTGNRLCGNDWIPVTLSGASPRSLVSVVTDLQGSNDGKGDLVVLDPDTLGFTRYHSQSFVAQSPLYLGMMGAMVQ